MPGVIEALFPHALPHSSSEEFYFVLVHVLDLVRKSWALKLDKLELNPRLTLIALDKLLSSLRLNCSSF